MIADRIGGNANIASHTRMTIASNSPRRAAAATPSAVPIVMPTITDKAEIDSELKAPAISIDSTSRPRWSVPKRPLISGSFSFCRMRSRFGFSGVHTSASRATATKTKVMAAPVTSRR